MATPRVLGHELRLAANWKNHKSQRFSFHLMQTNDIAHVRRSSDSANQDCTYLVLGTRGLEEGLVCSSTTGDDTDHTTAGAGENLLGAGGELDTGPVLVGVVADDGHVVTGGTAKRTTVTRLVLDVGEDGTFGDGAERKDVADGKSGVLAGVDEL